MIKLLTISSFISMLLAYSFHSILWAGAFYHLIALGFVLLTRVVWMQKKSKLNLLIQLLAVSNLFDELFFDPTKLELNEYVMAIITAIIVYKWKR